MTPHTNWISMGVWELPSARMTPAAILKTSIKVRPRKNTST